MRVSEVTWRNRNDYNAILECEHCQHTQRASGLYADAFFAMRVLPSRYYCDGCGLNALGEKRAEAVTA